MPATIAPSKPTPHPFHSASLEIITTGLLFTTISFSAYFGGLCNVWLLMECARAAGIYDIKQSIYNVKQSQYIVYTV